MKDEVSISEHISKRIKELRQSHPKTERKTTQERLAKACAIERSTLTNIELGNQRAPLVVIYRVCDYFGIELPDLLPDLQSIYTQDSATVEVGESTHQIGGGRTLALIESLKSTRG